MSGVDAKRKLEGALEMATSFLRDIPRTDYLICAVTRGEAQGEGAAGMRTNLCWHDTDERLLPLTFGSMVDLLLEVRLHAEVEQIAQENWRNEQPSPKPQ